VDRICTHFLGIIRDGSIAAKFAHPRGRQHRTSHPLFVVLREQFICERLSPEIRFKVVGNQVLLNVTVVQQDAEIRMSLDTHVVNMFDGVQQSRIGVSASISKHAAFDGIEDLERHSIS